MTTSNTIDSGLQEFLQQQPKWSVADGKLHRQYVFSDFVQAFGFMTQVALLAERSNHHPEWFNVYKTVVVDLITHEQGAITNQDFDLAQKMERLFVSSGA